MIPLSHCSHHNDSQGTKYSALNAAIVRAKASHVEAALIARATKKLGTLEVAKPCDLQTCKKTVKWKNVTVGNGGPIENCCDMPGCTIGAKRDGELCEIQGGMVQEALAAFCMAAPADNADRWLFEQLSEAIVKGFDDNALYRSGKHVIFSNPNRYACRMIVALLCDFCRGIQYLCQHHTF
eukprot:SAG31_NODE_142_length_22669_cov_18.630040_11_plen_181_part_00